MSAMKCVFDTDVVVAAIRSPNGASAALIRALQSGQIKVAASVALFVEYEATCTRAEHVQAAGLKISDVSDFLDALAGLMEQTDIHFLWRPQVRDPADDMVLEAAVNAMADAIVSFNIKDFANAPQRFGIDVLLPRDALARLHALNQ
jgi:putative PIN family toxin of toxin-antitoxin system